MTFTDVLAAVPGDSGESAAFLFLLLLLYSFVGWCGEMAYCSLGQRRLCEKRGFLNGPVCPIYGHGALLVLLALDGGCANPVFTFLWGMVLTSAVEYVTSWLMEKLFHMRWWDYSNRRFHLNGRICLRNSLLFGAACVLLCHGPGPALASLPLVLMNRGTGTAVAFLLGILYAADILLSVRSAVQITARLEQLRAIHNDLTERLERLKAEHQQAAALQRELLEEALAAAKRTAEESARAIQTRLEPLSGELAQRRDAAKRDAQQRLQALCAKADMFERRLLSSFPYMRSARYGEVLEKLREYWENRED